MDNMKCEYEIDTNVCRHCRWDRVNGGLCERVPEGGSLVFTGENEMASGWTKPIASVITIDPPRVLHGDLAKIERRVAAWTRENPDVIVDMKHSPTGRTTGTYTPDPPRARRGDTVVTTCHPSMQYIAGEDLNVGDLVGLGSDGRLYKGGVRMGPDTFGLVAAIKRNDAARDMPVHTPRPWGSGTIVRGYSKTTGRDGHCHVKVEFTCFNHAAWNVLRDLLVGEPIDEAPAASRLPRLEDVPTDVQVSRACAEQFAQDHAAVEIACRAAYDRGVAVAREAIAAAKYDGEHDHREWSVRDVNVPGWTP